MSEPPPRRRRTGRLPRRRDRDEPTQPGGAQGFGGIGYPPPLEPRRPSLGSGRAAGLVLVALLLLIAAAWADGVVPLRVLLHPPGATAVCRDGSYSYAQHHGGACSHHHGVAAWITGLDADAAPIAARADP